MIAMTMILDDRTLLLKEQRLRQKFVLGEERKADLHKRIQAELKCTVTSAFWRDDVISRTPQPLPCKRRMPECLLPFHNLKLNEGKVEIREDRSVWTTNGKGGSPGPIRRLVPPKE
jgi:hypothetical protein